MNLSLVPSLISQRRLFLSGSNLLWLGLVMLLSGCGGSTGGTRVANDLSISVSSTRVMETSGSATLELTLTSASTSEIRVNYTTQPESALAPGDFVSSNGTIIFEPGSVSKTVTITINDDAEIESNETFSLVISDAVGAVIGSGTGTVTIDDDDSGSGAVLSAANAVALENGDLSFVLSLSAVTADDVTVDFSTLDGTAVAGADYSSTSGTATINAGSTTTTIVVALLDDALDENTEQLTLQLSNVTNASANGNTLQILGEIQDNDTSPTLSVTDVSVSEGDTGSVVASVTVSLDAPSGRDVTATYQTQDASAVAGQDYVATSGSLSVGAGSLQAQIDVTITGDTAVEGNEFFFLLLTGASNSVLGDDSATILIEDDDQATGSDNSVSVASLADTIEGQPISVSVELATAATGTLTVDYLVFDGSARAGQDYSTTSGTLSFTTGASTASFSIPTIDDDVYESVETLAVVLSNPSAGLILGNGSAVGMILDNDNLPELTIADQSFAEGNVATIAVTLDKATSQTVVFDYSTSNGTAIAGQDYANAAGTVSINPGETTAMFQVTLTDDSLDEPVETFQILLSNTLNAQPSTLDATISITDNDDAPTLSVADSSAEENSGSIAFNVSLSVISAQTITVDYSLAGVDATAGSDYQNSSATLTFAPGQLTVPVLVTLINDTDPEPSETFNLLLTSPVNATLGDAQAVGTITDNDAPTTAAVSDSSVVEGDSNSVQLVFTVGLSSTRSAPTTFDYATTDGTATAGVDYTSATGSLTIPAGSNSAEISITVLGDTDAEGSETVQLTLSNPVGADLARATAVGTIQDNEGSPSLVIGDAAATEGNGSAGNLTFTVTLSPSSSSTVTVDYAVQPGTAVAGQDYTNTSGSLTFAAGQTVLTFSVPLVPDALDEDNETLSALLSNANGADIADASANGLITDDDAAPSVSIGSANVSEGAGTANIPVTLNTASGRVVTVTFATSNGTANAGSDFTSSSQNLSFAAGVTSLTPSVSILNDTNPESTESFTVSLSSPTNASIGTASGTVTISDDDNIPNVSIADASVTEGNSGTSIAVVVATLSAASSSPTSVAFSTSNGTATAGNDFTSTNSTVSFAANVTTGSISIPIIGDTTQESTESFTVNLSAPNGLTINDGSASVTITDNDSGGGGPVGLANRPSNSSCVAPTRTTGGGSWTIVDAFPQLPALIASMKLVQPINDSSQWYSMGRNGTIHRFANSPTANSLETYLTVQNVSQAGEGGLLSGVLHPNWPATKEIFVSYYSTSSGAQTRLSRLVINDDSSLPASFTEQILMTISQPFDNHNGGDLVIGNDGFIYWSSGDGGSGGDPQNNGQDPTTLRSTIIRIDAIGVSYPSPGYNIPAGNPYAGNSKCGPGSNASNCPEIFAYGFRNPWRMSFDSATNALWTADVGEGAYEEIDVVTVGKNYGWNECEGSRVWSFANNPPACTNPALELPVYDYPHESGNISITGGFVYRGGSLTDLTGRYVFSDYGSGRIWALQGSPGSYTAELLVDTPENIHSFSEGNDRELLIHSFSTFRIYKLQSSGGVSSDNVPASLVDTGCVNVANPTQPASGLVPYAPAAKFWSDNAIKDRWVGLPDGATIDVDAQDDWVFPTGTVLMKNFTLGNTLVETRLFMRHPDGEWAGYSYEWNAGQTSATRNDAGSTRSVNGQQWIYPSQAECLSCHTTAAKFALGLETAQLNTNFTYPSTGIEDNQLEVFNHINMFSVDVAEPVSLNPALVDPFDTSKTLDERARSYLHTNCASCHVAGGPANVSINLDYRIPLAQSNTCDVVPQAGNAGISNARIIAPGDPARSVLLERVNRRDSLAMPPLGSNVADAAGVALLQQWIQALTVCP